MGDVAARTMSLAEFLVWDDGTDTRYELVGGRPRAMAPAVVRHGVIQQSTALAIQDRLGRDGPCKIIHQGGVLLSIQGDVRFYVPDLVITCHPASDVQQVEEPKLVVEIISPSPRRTDKDVKVPDYCSVGSLDEIWQIDSLKPLVHVYQRRNGQWIGSVPFKLGQHFESVFLGAEVSIDDLYRNSGLELATEPPTGSSSGQS